MIQEEIKEIKAQLPARVRLVAVSKYQPVEAVQEAYDGGQRLFGENIAQEMRMKHEVLPQDIQWHFIGHLQTNKVKYVAPYAALIQSVDSLKLLEEINKCAAKHNRVVNCLLQIHIASEEEKFGFSFDECRELLKEGSWKTLDNVHISGLMGIATNTEDVEQVKREFKGLHGFFEEVKRQWFAGDDAFCELSMGMSADYPLAIEEGCTLIRVGSKIFGKRKTKQ